MLERTFEEDLKYAVAYHGHLCVGQILGTRIARLGLEYFGIEKPEEYRDLIAFVEADRCVADAVCSVAKCQLGRRRLKWYDYGKMAASFYDLQTKRAVRIVTMSDKKAGVDDDPVTFFEAIPDGELFRMQEVEIDLDEYDIPGKPKRHVVCERCGEHVMDNRDVTLEGKTLCQACAGYPTYYRVVKTLPGGAWCSGA
ncbi:MAG: FmdE family protein [Raoultibacter sp.]